MSTAHWSDAWLGREYDAARFNCADLALAVQREHFGRALDIVGAHPVGALAQAHAVEAEVWRHAQPIDAPRDGAVVLLEARGRLRHIGVYCDIAGGMVLHAMKKAGVIRTPLRDLPRIGMRIEGYYLPC